MHKLATIAGLGIALLAGTPAVAFPPTSYECGAIKSTPETKDRDPVYKIMVHLNDTEETAEQLEVIHVTVDGKTYARRNQYRWFSVKWKNSHEATWVGQNARESEMRGEFIMSSAERKQGSYSFPQYALYTERLLKNGRVVATTTSRCHLVPKEGE